MPMLSQFSCEAATGHQNVEKDDLPSGSDIQQKLVDWGHFTPLETPSDNHKNQIIPKPQFTLLTRSLMPQKI